MSSTDAAPETPAASPKPTELRKTDMFELISVVLLALAAIATAWAGFEAAKWGGVQASNNSQAAAARTESVRASTVAGQQSGVDINTFFNWLNAVSQDIEDNKIEKPKDSADYKPDPGTLSGFTFERFRPEFTPSVEAWLDTSPFQKLDAPPTPFVMPEYEVAARVQAEDLQADADEHAALAADANQNGDNYVVSAVVFATALFFAALSGKLASHRLRVVAISVAGLLFIGTLIYLITLPIEL